MINFTETEQYSPDFDRSVYYKMEYELKWNNTNDKLPEENENVLVYVDDWEQIAIGRYTGRVWIMENQKAIVLHWMELPYSPNELK